ncbi:MAG: glycosyltransferase [Acidithiobacillus sp.]|nr:glycosyltransferase [Acidithiobacillus sp.]
MKKILAFSFFPAFVPPSNGGQSRLFYLYQALSRWHHVTLLTSTHIGVEEEIINHGLNFIEKRIPKDDHFVNQYAMLEKSSGGGDLSGPAIAASGRLPTRLHQAYFEEYPKADIVFHDFPFTIDYDLFADLGDKPRVYNSHNCESQLYAQLHPGDKSRPIHELILAAERRMLEKADLVLYCNEGDLAAFREIAPDADYDSLYAPNGMAPTAVMERSFAAENKVVRAVFMGSGHPPNVHAAEFIANSLAPALPEIVFDVIGSCLPEGQYPANLKRHGVVDDATKARILVNADVALNPMAAGSGSNVKVLDYFAYGLPVVSTSFGMRGIKVEAGKHYLESTVEQFAHVLRHSAKNPTLLAAVGTAGKELALKSYTWEAIAHPVAKRVDKLVAGKIRKGRSRFVLALNDYDSFACIGGGCTRTQGLYDAVQGWCPVVFVTFSGDSSIGARPYGRSITVFNVPKTTEHIADLERVNAQFHISADDIIASRHCTANPWLNAVYGMLRQSARCVVAEHCYMAGLPLAWGDRFVYSSHNNETELKQRLLEWHPLKAELLSVVERIERLAVERSAVTIAVSREDAESLVKGKRTVGPVIVVPNGAAKPAVGTLVEDTQEELRDRIGDRAVIFVGSAHMPNVAAAQFIVEQLVSKCPDVRFHILGSVCSALERVPDNVHLWGVVDEATKSAVMQSCALALNPMLSGSGSNVKLADYLGNGLFVVSTKFGLRGYPYSIQKHVAIAPLERFAEAIHTALDDPAIYSDEEILTRRTLFDRELSMSGIARRFLLTLQDLEKPRKRVLFVTYRYVFPALGGAEAHIEKFITALGNSGDFDVDVIAPEISGIHNHERFSERYSFDSKLGVPVDIPNVRFARFAADTPDPRIIDIHLRKTWLAQLGFEQELDRSLRDQYKENGLSWGWGYPEGDGENATLWAFTECEVYLNHAARIDLEAYASHAIVTTAYNDNQIIAGPWTLDGEISLSFDAPAGEVHLVTSALRHPADPRPLAFRVSRLAVGGQPMDLSAPTLLQRHLPLLPAEQSIRLLDHAAEISRMRLDARLTDGRGPWSSSLECFIAEHVAEYDLVITHNNVFRPAVVAIEQAKKHGVPSILIPHAHLDDDFYHFPDVLECARNASLILAVPKVACKFLAEKGCNVKYLPAGCDTAEEFTEQDVEAFRRVYKQGKPFILVLGRKAGAKGYQLVIDAVDKLNRDGVEVQAVLIGPDDDGRPVESPNAVYLGRQPRDVVRGALMSCLALCNMSVSESFGMVILEGWLAGCPVIANKDCAAFNDLIEEGVNGILIFPFELGAVIIKLINDAEIRARISSKGILSAKSFDWGNVSNEFLGYARDLSGAKDI